MSEECFEDIDQNCFACYEITQTDCTDITIQAGLTPSTAYYLVMIAPDGNQYQTAITIAGDGSFDVSIDNYPDGMMNAYAGDFEFFLSVSNVNLTPVAFTISAVSYTCLMINWTLTCCNSSYVPPTACADLLATLTAAELNECILPTYDFADATNVQPNVTSGQQTDLITWLCGDTTSIIFAFDAGQTTTTVTAIADMAATYTTENLVNVTSVVYTVNAVVQTLPFAVALNDTVICTIVQTNAAIASVAQILE